MIQLNASEILEKQGKTRYWLQKQLGMSYQNLRKMLNNETSSIKYEVIENMCEVLECTPSELLGYTKEN